MKYVLYALFIAAIIFLSYMMMDSIRRPVNFRNTWEARKTVVHKRLEEIAELQKMYKVLHNDTIYAGNFDSMEHSFLTDSFYIMRINGDPFDTTKRADTINLWYPARDSMASLMAKQGFIKIDELNEKRNKAHLAWADTSQEASQNPDVQAYLTYVNDNIKKYFKELRIVPFSQNKEFVIASSKITLEGSKMAMGQTSPTFEVATTVGTYMHEFEPVEFSMYDPVFDPGKMVKVGDLTKVTTSGNW